LRFNSVFKIFKACLDAFASSKPSYCLQCLKFDHSQVADLKIDSLLTCLTLQLDLVLKWNHPESDDREVLIQTVIYVWFLLFYYSV